jgi:hypothetical protein
MSKHNACALGSLQGAQTTTFFPCNTQSRIGVAVFRPIWNLFLHLLGHNKRPAIPPLEVIEPKEKVLCLVPYTRFN